MAETDGSDRISGREFLASDGIAAWRAIWGGAWAVAYFQTDSFATGLAFVDRIGDLAAAAEHYPDIDVRRDGVTVRLFSAKWGDISRHDAELARQISTAASSLGIAAKPERVQQVQITIDATDIAAVRPFWAAVLGYEDVGEEDVFDPRRQGAPFSFQQMDEPRPQRNRIHIDLYLPHDHAEQRIAAAVAAGGRVVNDDNAPGWWTLADPEGNEVDVAIWMAD